MKDVEVRITKRVRADTCEQVNKAVRSCLDGKGVKCLGWDKTKLCIRNISRKGESRAAVSISVSLSPSPISCY